MARYSTVALMIILVGFSLSSNLKALELKQPDEKAVLQLMENWNEVAKDRNLKVGDFNINFVWKDYDYFPHPTYKGGSDTAYNEMMEVMAIFLSKKGAIEFIRENNLTELPLHYIVGKRMSYFGTFASYVDDVASGVPLDNTVLRSKFMDILTRLSAVEESK